MRQSKRTTADALLELSPYLRHLSKRLGKSTGPRLAAHRDYDPVLGTAEAAEYTGLHQKTLLEDARAGLVAYCRRSDGDRGPLRFRLSDLNSYLDAQRVEPTKQKDPTDEIDWGSL